MIYKALCYALGSVVCNIAFSLYYLHLGATSDSYWLTILGIYYFLLSVVRFVVLKTRKKPQSILKFAGIMLMLLSIPVSITVVLSVLKDRGNIHHEIIMITIAVYAFTKLTLSVFKLIKARHIPSAKMTILRDISFADAIVSLFALQRSMLVSFDGMTEQGIRIMNLATGIGVTCVILVLGFNLLSKSKVYRKGS